MKLLPGRIVLYLLLCFCAYAVSASVARSEPSTAGSKPALSNSSQQSAADQSSDTSAAQTYITIPGPLRSFLRMAAISQEVQPEDVVPLFGHFVETYGYEEATRDSAKQTEALTLFKRYFAQAQSLAALAGSDGTIRFSSCEQAKPLLDVLGYRLIEGCGQNQAIHVDNPERAFTTVDSGFPLADVEAALLQGKPFSTPYHSVRLPLIYTKRDWTGQKNAGDASLIDSLAANPEMARLYWALSQMDEPTRDVLKQSGIKRMLPLAAVLDFYGSTLAVQHGRVAVPGGIQADAAWARLVGADPNRPAAFLAHLLQKDSGCLAEYFDAIARAPEPQVAYLTSGDHLRRFYAAFRGHDRSDDAVRPSFRPEASLLLLVTRLSVDSNNEPLVPGGLGVWKQAFYRRSYSKTEREWAQTADRWTTPEQLLEGLFALSRSYSENGPLEMYLSLTEIDRRRPPNQRMSAAICKLLIAHFAELHDQYETFSEFADLDDASIAKFIALTQKIDRIRDPLLRGDTMGIFEANIGLWQIVARQGQIGAANLNDSWQRMITPFGQASSSAQLFDAARASLAELMNAATGMAQFTQEQLINLLAGPDQTTADGQEVHGRIAAEMAQVLADQRLVSLDTLFELGDDVSKMAQNPKTVDLTRDLAVASGLREAPGPRPMFTNAERAEGAPGEKPNQHVLREMKTDPTKLFSKVEQSAKETRGALTPYLRDTLVGLNYAYYEPPGSQILHNSPLLVRSHDFLASESAEKDQAWLAPRLFGVGFTAANGTHLWGSLAGLPFALAEMQQDLIVPTNVQSLIWQGVAAEILTGSTVPRWWSTSPEALHAAALYQETGEELVAAAAKDADLRAAVLQLLSNHLLPPTIDSISDALRQGHIDMALDFVSPAASFDLTAEFQSRFPGRIAAAGPGGTELEALIQRDPDQVNPGRLSAEFGVPHPFLAQSYRQGLLDLKLFPSVMDYASELLAESWESTNLYWARLADEMGYSPARLNELAPMLARSMVASIFSSDFDDWPALNRALHEAGREFRTRRASSPEEHPAPEPLSPVN